MAMTCGSGIGVSPVAKRDRSTIRRSRWCATALAVAALLAGAPRVAQAQELPEAPTCSWGKCGYPLSDRLEVLSYGRIGFGWVPGSGLIGRGISMNLGDHRELGGRLEQGDYILNEFIYHLYDPTKVKDGDVKTDAVLGLEIYGSPFASNWASNDRTGLVVNPGDIYIIERNALVKGLATWMGSRLYRFNDVHIADYFYFNDNPGIGAGADYGQLQTAVLLHTASTDKFYQTDIGTAAAPKIVQRARTQLLAMYKVPFGNSNYLQGLGEFQFVPRLGTGDQQSPGNVDPPDYGWALGVKMHMDLDNGMFNDTSIRYGGGIANGAESGGRTWETFGLPAADGTYKGAFGLEFVDHFLFNFGPAFSLNGFGAAHYSQGARDYVPTAAAVMANPSLAAGDARWDVAVGARATYFATEQLHLNGEATFQTRQDTKVCNAANCNQSLDMGTATKLAVFPAIVPNGAAGPYHYWDRPEIRLVYLLGFYNQAAQNQLMSTYLKEFGPTSVAQYLGIQTEWWFGF